MDGLVRHFFARSPDGIGVALYPGLCTRFCRIDNGALHWIDIDRPGVAAFKCNISPTAERHVVAASCSLGCSGWLNLLRDARDVPLLVSEGPLSRHAADVVETFLTHASERMPRGTEFVVGYDARLPLRRHGACLEVPKPDGSVARYPRLHFVAPEEIPAAVEHQVAGLNGVSRLFGGRGIASIAHLRFC